MESSSGVIWVNQCFWKYLFSLSSFIISWFSSVGSWRKYMLAWSWSLQKWDSHQLSDKCGHIVRNSETPTEPKFLCFHPNALSKMKPVTINFHLWIYIAKCNSGCWFLVCRALKECAPGARSYFEERSLERAPFENTGAEAGARSYFWGARTLERAPLFKCQ